MPAIVKNNHRILAADYFQYNAAKNPLYVFIGGTTPWDTPTEPPEIKDSTDDTIFAFDEMIGGKRVLDVDITSVLPRIDWKSGSVYDQYDNKVNLIDDKNPETMDFYKFYVMTDEFDVYKCISNGYRSISTIKPTGRSIESFNTPDGYIWKFMYNIKPQDSAKFVTPNWIPCYSLSYNDQSAQWLVQSASVRGTVDSIDIVDQGSGYSTADGPTVTVVGDGTGARAVAQIDDNTGQITDIIVVDRGEGYTHASLTISGGSGVGATAICYISPIEGHGYDARIELGAIYKMIRVSLDGDENGVLPVNNVKYRKVGLISKPLDKSRSGVKLRIADKEQMFSVGDTITGNSSGTSGEVVSVDMVGKLIYVNNTTGLYAQREIVTNGIVNTELLLVEPAEYLPLTKSVFNYVDDFVPMSGEVIYLSTREEITRGSNQTEEIRMILQF